MSEQPEVIRELQAARETKWAEAIWPSEWSEADLSTEEVRSVMALAAEETFEATSALRQELAQAQAENERLRGQIETDHCAACGNGMGLCRSCEAEVKADRAALAAEPTPADGMGDWFRRTPESLAMLAEETKALAESEAAYQPTPAAEGEPAPPTSETSGAGRPEPHAEDGACWRHDYGHREYVCRCNPPVQGDAGMDARPAPVADPDDQRSQTSGAGCGLQDGQR